MRRAGLLGARRFSSWSESLVLPRPVESGSMGAPSSAPPSSDEFTVAPPPSSGSPPTAPHDVFDLMAVPKRKVTPARKGMRSTHKHWKAIPMVAQCSMCGRVMKQHEIPHKCGEAQCPSLQFSRSGAPAAAPATTE
mmetsp:Transcript_37082/g.66361  ORF Transcript_37082/g.66361 Transcript_37082/m.66361 type:complete len:136 (-) Transcript_37082:106-513(-)